MLKTLAEQAAAQLPDAEPGTDPDPWRRLSILATLFADKPTTCKSDGSIIDADGVTWSPSDCIKFWTWLQSRRP